MRPLYVSVLFSLVLSASSIASATVEDGVEARVRAPFAVPAKKTESFSSDYELAKLNAKLERHITAETLLARAKIYTDKGNFVSALEDLDNSLAMKKQLPQAFFLRAYIHAQLKSYDKAVDDYLAYMKSNSNNAKAWISLAACYEALNKNDKALEAFDQAIKADPKEMITYANKADLLGRMNRYQDAQQVLKQCLSIDPNCHVCLYERAYLKESVLHDDKGALKDLTDLIADHDDYPKVFLERAAVEIKLGDLDAAKKDYDTVIKLYPKMDVGWAERAALEFIREEYQEAASDYAKAISLSPNRVDLLDKRAEVDRYLHDWRAAQVDAGQALRMNPDDAEAFLERAYTFMDELRPTDARPDFEMVIHLTPTNSAAYFGRAFSYAETGDFLNAADDFKQVIKLGVGDLGYSYVYLALMQKLADADSEAQATLERATSVLDKNSWPYQLIQLIKGGLKEEALLAMADAKDKKIGAHMTLGLLALAADKNEVASTEFTWVSQNSDQRTLEYGLAEAGMKSLEHD